MTDGSTIGDAIDMHKERLASTGHSRRWIVRLTAGLAIFLATSLAALQLAGAQTGEKVDRLNVPGPIVFDGTSYALAWSARPMPNYYKQEYLPAGQASKTYSRMVLVELLSAPVSPRAAAAEQVKTLNKRKTTDPLVNMQVLQNEKTGEVMLDFIVSSRDAHGGAIVEWNAYRYAPRAQGKDGVILLGVSHRAYGQDDAKAFLTGLKTFRVDQIRKLSQQTIPDARPSQ